MSKLWSGEKEGTHITKRRHNLNTAEKRGKARGLEGDPMRTSGASTRDPEGRNEQGKEGGGKSTPAF